MSKEREEELNDPGNEDPGSLMDDAQVPLKTPDDAAAQPTGRRSRSSNKRSSVATGKGRNR